MKNALILILTFCAVLVFQTCSNDDDLMPNPTVDGNKTLLLSGYQRITLGESNVTYDNNIRQVMRQLILPIEQFGDGVFAMFGLNVELTEFVAFSLDDDEEFTGNAFAVLEGAFYSGDDFSLNEIDENRFQLTGILTNDANGDELPIEVVMDLRNFGSGTSTFTINGDTAILNGTLGSKSYNQLLNLNANHRNVHIITFQNISGSENDEVNLQLGKLIREAGYTTIASATSKIHSGGVDLFCAGKERYVESGAEFGVHAWCCSENGEEASEIPIGEPEHEIMINYFIEMLGTSIGENFYFFTINSAPFNELYVMTADDITQYGLETD